MNVCTSRWIVSARLFRIASFLAAALVISTASARGAVSFPHVFSPQTGLTAPVEQPWRQEICLNGSWQFQPIPLPPDYDLKNGAPLLPPPSDSGWSATPIRIPSPWNVNAFHLGGFVEETFPSYPKEWAAARMGWLRRNFKVPADWKEKRLILTFEAVAGHVQVLVNGQQVAEHFDNSLPFSVDVTDFVNRSGENTLLLGVRQPSLFDVPSFFGKNTYPAGSDWTLQIVGVWQDVYLRAVPALHVEDIAVRPRVDQKVLELSVTVRNDTPVEQSVSVGGHIHPWLNKTAADLISAPVPNGELSAPVIELGSVDGRVGPRMTTTLVLRQPIEGELKFWTPETPNLYGLVLDVQQDGKIQDRFYQRFGWRQWGIAGRDVTLNGKPYQLRADSGHLLGVSYLTRRYAWSWYKALKDVNGNAIRLHASIRPRFYLELADEMGVAILDESDLWASSMDYNYSAPETWQRFGAHIDGLVLRDRNHASVFGWSIANEILSALWWKGIPRKLWPPVIDNVVKLADRVRALDPTRPWISSDGDGDFHGRLPTYVYHYGKPQDWRRQAPKDKPFGIGEGGSMVWGSPAVFAAYNGERSYESRVGMEEGTAIEIYQYLVEQRKMSAFCSIFTIANSCFEPLKLGAEKSETSPDARDGIQFGPFVEGQPGIQPERLPAWSTNFNPGYDPSQPFYITTPVFEAVKAAYAPEGPQPCKWDHEVKSPERPAPPPPTINRVAFVGENGSALANALESAGILAVRANEGDEPAVLVIDGETLRNDRVVEAQRLLQHVLGRHGSVLVWASPQEIDSVNKILPRPIEFVAQKATALFADRSAPETASMALADLYFADQSDRVILKAGLAGPLVQESRVLMETNSFGQRWYPTNDQARIPALIATNSGGGRLLVTSLLPDVRSARRLMLMRSLFAGLGVAFGEPNPVYNRGFDGAGKLNQALVLGAFQGELYPEILERDFVGDEARANPSVGENVGNRQWQKVFAGGDGMFDFFKLALPGTEGSRARAQGSVLKPEALDANNYLESAERVSGTNPGTNSVAYLSFWVQAPGPIEASDLRLAMLSDDGTKIWVNSRLIYADAQVFGPGMTEPQKVPLALQAGWNHVLVKIGQLDGLWHFSARFESNDPTVAEGLRAAAERP